MLLDLGNGRARLLGKESCSLLTNVVRKGNGLGGGVVVGWWCRGVGGQLASWRRDVVIVDNGLGGVVRKISRACTPRTKLIFAGGVFANLKRALILSRLVSFRRVVFELFVPREVPSVVRRQRGLHERLAVVHRRWWASSWCMRQRTSRRRGRARRRGCARRRTSWWSGLGAGVFCVAF
jgi:hypothetical protein